MFDFKISVIVAVVLAILAIAMVQVGGAIVSGIAWLFS